MLPSLADLLIHVDLLPFHPQLQSYRVELRHSELWIVFHGAIEKVPFFAARIHYDGGRPPRADFYSLDRFRNFTEWYNEAKFWLPYIPDGKAYAASQESYQAAWMHADYEDLSSFRDPAQPDRFSLAAIHRIEEDFELVGELLDIFDGHAGLQRTAISTTLNSNSLYLSRTDACMRFQLDLAREAMLNALGALSYIVHNLPDNDGKATLQAEYGEELQRWLVLDAPKIGCMLDLKQHHLAPVPVLAWLRDGVPLYYPWDEEYRPSPSLLARVHPEYAVDDSNFAAHVDAVCGKRYENLPPSAGAVALRNASLAERLDAVPAVYLSSRRESFISQLRAQATATIQPVLFFYQPPAFPIVGLGWSSFILDHGVLKLPRLTEAKLRIFVLANRVSDVGDILSEAVQRGMEFSIALPKTALHDLQQSRPVPRHPRPRYVQVGFVDAVLPYNPRGREVAWAQYLRDVRELLSRPHAITFLFRGGILSRLAREFGPPEQDKRLMRSPSYTLVHYNRGREEITDCLQDTVSDSECYRLLGVTLAPRAGVLPRRWWPSPVDFYENDFFAGEWTEAHESWFRTRLTQIREGHRLGRPLTEREWKKELGGEGIRFREEIGELPDDDDVERLCLGLETAMGAWAQVPLRNIQVFDE